MAKKKRGFDPKSIKDVFDFIGAKLTGKFTQDELTDIAKTAVRNIKGATRSGKSLVTDSDLPPLKPFSVEIRAELAKTNKTSKLFSPERSNLTFTGELLNSINNPDVNVSRQEIRITPKGIHKAIEGGSEARSNEEIARDLANRGFLFLGLNEKVAKQITNLIKRIYRRKLLKK